MMVIFWHKYGILLTEYLSHGSMINASYYTSIVDRLCCVIVEKRRGKVGDEVSLLHVNAPVHKCNIFQTVIRKADFVELNHHVYFPDITPFDYYLLSNLKKFLRDKNFSRDDETIDTVEDYLNKLDLEYFCKGIESLHDCWQRVIAA